MAKTKIFVSYDYEHDSNMKNNLIAESKKPDSPFSINDLSLQETMIDWQQEARSAIEKCDVFVVLLGDNTHQASGVKREVTMAKEIGKKRIQIRNRGHLPKPLDEAGDVIVWKWTNLKNHIRK